MGEEHMARIEQLWWEHKMAIPFPWDCSNQVLDKADLALLDADIAGCVSVFLKRRGELDLWRTAVLGLCGHEVARFLPALEGECLVYFTRLEELVVLTLREVIARRRPCRAAWER